MVDPTRKAAAVEILRDTLAKARVLATGDMNFYYQVLHSKNSRISTVWRNLAQWCLENDINPRAFVEWACVSSYPSLPMPHVVAGDPNKTGYLAAGKPDIKYDQEELKLRLKMLRLHKKDPNEDLIKFLLDPVNDFDNLFIYIVAKGVDRQSELPKEILVDARKQTFCNPVFNERFRDIVPEETLVYGPEQT